MKVLTATTLTQGQRASDFTWCIDGELVMPSPFICAHDRAEGPDGGCGCGRSFDGLSSHKSTTTARVVDKPGWTRDDLTEAIRGYRQAAGWEALDEEGDPAEQVAIVIGEIVAGFDDGDVLEFRLGVISQRRQ
jgi:hypothetical protein